MFFTSFLRNVKMYGIRECRENPDTYCELLIAPFRPQTSV